MTLLPDPHDIKRRSQLLLSFLRFAEVPGCHWGRIVVAHYFAGLGWLLSPSRTPFKWVGRKIQPCTLISKAGAGYSRGHKSLTTRRKRQQLNILVRRCTRQPFSRARLQGYIAAHCLLCGHVVYTHMAALS